MKFRKRPPIGVKCKHTVTCMGPIITIYFPTTAILMSNLDVYLIFQHMVHTCEYGRTTWFTNLLDRFLVERAYSLVAVDVEHPLVVATFTTAL